MRKRSAVHQYEVSLNGVITGTVFADCTLQAFERAHEIGILCDSVTRMSGGTVPRGVWVYIGVLFIAFSVFLALWVGKIFIPPS